MQMESGFELDLLALRRYLDELATDNPLAQRYFSTVCRPFKYTWNEQARSARSGTGACFACPLERIAVGLQAGPRETRHQSASGANMFLLEKIILQCISPLGLSLLLMPLGLILIVLRKKRSTLGWCMVALPLIWMWIWSIPAASIWLRQGLERQTAQRAANDYPTADAIVVLGGSVEGGRSGWRDGPHLLGGADRIWFGAQLYRAGRAPVVILSGGNSEWSRADEPESRAMRAFAIDLGVPETSIRIEDRSRNTRENALYTKQLLDTQNIGSILLVTSAMHMPRALAVFRSQGINAIPAPTDFDAIPPRNQWQHWLPDAETLDRSTMALKEYLAMGIYRFQGITP